MKIVVLGLWHLGCVTAACCAKFCDVVGLDFDLQTIEKLRAGKPPVFEPGLEELIRSGLTSGRLSFESEPAVAVKNADLLWVSYDTPVDEDDQADVTSVLNGIDGCLSYLQENAMVLISSQIPAGTCRSLEKKYPGRRFAYSPENLRLGKAIEIFLRPERIILGTRTEADADRLLALFRNFSDDIISVSTESAEVIKHAINSFLAVSIAFMNEVSRVCEKVGADAREVERGLKSEARIGPKAYLSPGGPFAGGTLARDVVTLVRLAEEFGENLVLIRAIKASNDQHKEWAIQRLREELGTLDGQRVAILGLTYKPGTDTLRRSLAIEVCRMLQQEGAQLTVFDPVVSAMPEDLIKIPLLRSVSVAVAGADGVVVATEWPELLDSDWEGNLKSMRHRIVVDANGFLRRKLPLVPGLRYRSVGRPLNV
jgi:UDPglucose 6-dehydrogenase